MRHIKGIYSGACVGTPALVRLAEQRSTHPTCNAELLYNL